MQKLVTGVSLLAATSSLLAAPTLRPGARDIIVALGDSITDGNTYPQLIMQALRGANKPVPTVVCGGAGGNTAAQMAARFEVSVLALKPTIVTMLAGTNDANQGVTPEAYEQALRDIAGKAKAAKIRLILCTPSLILPRLNPKPDDLARTQTAMGRVEAYTEIVRRVAREEGLPVADDQALMREAVARGETIMCPDGFHPDYHGQQLIARAILDALGWGSVALPATFAAPLHPGIVRNWRIQRVPLDPKGKPVALTDDFIRALQPDDRWVSYPLPESTPIAPTPEDWGEQIRRQGYAQRVKEAVGGAPAIAVGTVQAKRAQGAFLHTGASVGRVWFNGTCVYTPPATWMGFHAGSMRLPIRLRAGENTLTVEIPGSSFYVSVTEGMVWEKALR